MSAADECQRDPIFLFQFRCWNLCCIPDGYECDDEGDVVPEDQVDSEDRVGLTWDELQAKQCAVESWVTECVFLTREAGETYGKARHYNYRNGWRVHCVSAKGELASVLHGFRTRDPCGAFVGDPADKEPCTKPDNHDGDHEVRT